MALIDRILSLLFGGGQNLVRDTAEVFRENSESAAQRAAGHQAAALAQFAAEFGQPPAGLFDRIIDGLNRVPRPAMALGTLGLFIAAMVDPVWFASRMQGIALVPEPLWWLLAVIVSFYFGARHQAKGQEFQSRIAMTMARVPQVVDNLQALRAASEPARDLSPSSADTGRDAPLAMDSLRPEDNPALVAWRNHTAAPAR